MNMIRKFQWMIVYVGMPVLLSAQPGVYPYQDYLDIDSGSRGLTTAVNVVNGNLLHVRSDLSIPGRGLPLRVVFTYNSTDPQDGPFGVGWQMNYALKYEVDSVTGDVTILRGDGRPDRFVKQTDGTFEATLGIPDKLESIGQGYKLTVWSDRVNNNGDYTEYTFDASSHSYATRLIDRNGNALTLTCDHNVYVRCVGLHLHRIESTGFCRKRPRRTQGLCL